MKISPFSILLFFIFFLSCYTTNESRTAYDDLPFLKGLREVSTLELAQNKQFGEAGAEPLIYFPDGRKVPFLEMIDSTRDGQYGLVPFVDSTNQFILYLLRPTSASERDLINRAFTKSKKKSPKVLESFAPTFSLYDIDGKKVPISAFRGKVIVLNFWFIDCAPCIAEMPELNDLVAKYRGKEVVFLGIGLDNKSRTKAFLKDHEFNYRIFPNGREVAEAYHIQSYPSNLVIDPFFIVSYFSSAYGKNKIHSLDQAIAMALSKD